MMHEGKAFSLHAYIHSPRIKAKPSQSPTLPAERHVGLGQPRSHAAPSRKRPHEHGELVPTSRHSGVAPLGTGTNGAEREGRGPARHDPHALNGE
jgi:hypothetical protein